ncbi:MAG: HlyD family efflux transporter periplasmic adaptor subunit [Alphaproteobacteria bacterium]|nr:HlyD family efflux transporter periplasmic adaptor subunit [Alphaproteobacteria bacterium]
MVAHENTVISISQIIAQLVPKNDAIEVEAIMSKANCGLIEVGNKTIVKLQAFPYQIYGTLKGKVKSILPVSMNNVTKQNGVSVRIKLNTQKIKTEKNEITLKPMMQLKAVVNVSKVCIENICRCI